MRNRSVSRRLAITAPALAGALILAGCGSPAEEGGAEGGNEKTVKIGMIAPISGDLAALGQGMKNSADLAVKQANEDGAIEGWNIEFDPQDDTANAQVGAQAAAKLASDSEVAGVIGTLNSSVALQVQPILARANIVQISPANTLPDLTQGQKYLTKKERQFPNYFRVATTDAIQGPFGADYVFNELGQKTAVTVNDQLAYGVGLTAAFEREFTRLGGKIVARERVTQGDKDFRAVVTKLKAANPGVIYYGGQYPEGSLLSKQAKEAGLDVPLVGGDGLFDPTYIATAGPGSEGDVATTVGAPTEELESAQDFVDAYEEEGYDDDFSAYGAYTYDATNVLIQAMKRVLEGEDELTPELRKQIIQEVQKTDMEGATGEIGFDEFGDNTNRVLTVYAVKKGEFQPEKTASFEAS